MAIRKGLPTTPGHPGGPPYHSQTSRRDCHPLPDIQNGISTTTRHPGGPPDHSCTSGRAN